MAHLLAERVAESSTSTGTGAFTLTAAIAGHRRFSAVLALNDTTEYAIIADDGSWEVGIGTYSSTNVLTRTQVIDSSSAKAQISFGAGNKTVVISPLAQTLQGNYYGTFRRITGDMSNATASNRLSFQTSVTNGTTTIAALPNGTGTAAYLAAHNGSGADNTGLVSLGINATTALLNVDKTGAGSYVPLSVNVGGSEQMSIGTDGLFTVKGDLSITKAIKETVFTITDGASVDINPSNGTIQLWTLGASRTPTATNFQAGESVLMMIDDGASAFTVNWATNIGVVWETDGGSAPTLATSGFTPIVLWKTGTTVYGARVGNA